MTTHLPHAVAAPGIDAGIPWHYGDPLREQRAIARSAGVVDRSNRDVVRVSGPDRLQWLHTICSQHVSELADGDSTEALVLSPHGHVEQHWVLTELDDAVWIDTEPGAAATVLDYLQKMRFLKRVELEDVSGEWAVLSLVGPDVPAILLAAQLPVPDAHRASPVVGGGFVRRMSWPEPDAADLVVPRTALAETTDRLVRAGAEPAGLWAFEAMRVAARRPRLGFETDHRTIPHEVDWIGPAVHLQKGCYRGQETVARVQNLGRPPRRLVRLLLSGDSDRLPAAGTAILFEGRQVGIVGTSVHHYVDGPVALALIKRSIPDDARLQLDDSDVAIDTA